MRENGEAGWGFLFVDALRGIGLERWATRTVRHVGVPVVLAVALALWAVAQGGTPPLPGATRGGSPDSGPAAHAVARPVGLPAGSQPRAAACPAVPSLSTSPPSGVVFSPPSLAPAGLWAVEAAGQGHSGDWCSYAVEVSSER